MKLRHLFIFTVISLVACNPAKQISKSAREKVINDSALNNAHVGISIYEPATGKYLYNYDGDKYFVPASNTKIPTCYAAMKYLGDSLVGLRYGIPEERGFKKLVVFAPTADPTFFHEDFKQQPVFDSLKKWNLENKRLVFLYKPNDIERWGSGWSWNDYDEDYMAERSRLPIYGNVTNVMLLDVSKRKVPKGYPGDTAIRLFYSGVPLFDSLLNKIWPPIPRWLAKEAIPKVDIKRKIGTNEYSLATTQTQFRKKQVPFVTNDFSTALDILADTLKLHFSFTSQIRQDQFEWDEDDGDIETFHIRQWHTIHSQPTDSVLKPMMHRSDNFFAEQSLLMVSNEMLGVMNDEKIIDTLLKTDFKDLPQKPTWVDGCGLSRYNLFTPQDMVFILNKMQKEFGMERIKEIFATGGEGTLTNYYRSIKGFIYAKTGTLSGAVALSGFLYTKKNKLLIFSVLVNNNTASAPQVRRAVEKFIQDIREDF